MRNLVILIILTLNSFYIFSQKFSYFEIKPMLGEFLPHHKIMSSLEKLPSYGIELNYFSKHSSEEYFNKRYKYPFRGFGVSYMNLGNSKILGSSFSSYAILEFQLAKIFGFDFNFRGSSGLSYLTKKYDKDLNPQNIAIGTHLNYYFNLDFNLLYKWKNNNLFRFGAEFSHNSNGAVKKPNLGINQVFLYFSYNHLLTEKSEFNYSEYSRKNLSPHEVYAMITYSTSDEYSKAPEGRGAGFICSTQAIAYNYQYSNLGKLGVSHDIMYNANLRYYYDYVRDTLIMHHKEINEVLKYGLSFGHQLIYNRLEFIVFMGFYYYHQAKRSDKFYTRIGARYYLSDYFFINLSIRAFGFKAHYIESGIGFSFRKKLAN